MFFANRNTQKNMQLLDKIHTVFTAALTHRDASCVFIPHSLFPLIVVSFSPSVFLFRCVLHPLPLPLSSCLGCIPPLIGLPSLLFYAVASSLFLLSVCFCLCFLFYRDDIFRWLLSCPFSYVCFPCLSPIPGLIWFGSVYLVTTAWLDSYRISQCEKNNKLQQQQHVQQECVQQNPLCVASCVTMDLTISPRFSPSIFYRYASLALFLHLCAAVSIVSMNRTLCSN